MSGEITEKSSASRFKGYQSAMQEYLLSHQVQLLEGISLINQDLIWLITL